MSSGDMTQTRMAGSRFPMSSISRWSSTSYSTTQPETLVPNIKSLPLSTGLLPVTPYTPHWSFKGQEIWASVHWSFFLPVCLHLSLLLNILKKIFHIKKLCIINCIITKLHCKCHNISDACLLINSIVKAWTCSEFSVEAMFTVKTF